MYITSINLQFNDNVFHKTYLNDQAVTTYLFSLLICFDITSKNY